MEELIRSLIKFDGILNQDVIQWLAYIEEVFDRIQLQASNKYVAVQYFLTNGAATWFRYSKSNILDCFTFKRQISDAFPSPSSFFSSHLLDRHQLTARKEPQKLEQELDILHVPASSPTMSQKELDNDNTSLDSVNDSRIISVKDLEDKCLREREQGHYSPTLVNITDPDPKIKYQGFTRTMDSLTTDDSLINTFLPQDIQYLWSDKYKPRPSQILNNPPTTTI
ncbi:unnamed protein product [Rotaria sp. Silwood1]|nr:unnamed protein product [Rotaria sp. Silwood1]CAF1531535.1 unnamed protein product [Rotaria sp. Silwood1]